MTCIVSACQGSCDRTLISLINQLIMLVEQATCKAVKHHAEYAPMLVLVKFGITADSLASKSSCFVNTTALLGLQVQT